MSESLTNARWWADVRREAIAANVHTSNISMQDSAVRQYAGGAFAAGHMTNAETAAVLSELGLDGSTPRVGALTTKLLSSIRATTPPGSEFADPFADYARGIEQAIAIVRGDYARANNPTPRRDYTSSQAGSRLGVWAAFGAAVAAFAAARRARR